MQLHTVQITNFRSIEDSGVVPIERVAALVGKNESGKTNFLQALVRLNPAPGQPDQFDINDGSGTLSTGLRTLPSRVLR